MLVSVKTNAAPWYVLPAPHQPSAPTTARPAAHELRAAPVPKKSNAEAGSLGLVEVNSPPSAVAVEGSITVTVEALAQVLPDTPQM